MERLRQLGEEWSGESQRAADDPEGPIGEGGLDHRKHFLDSSGAYVQKAGVLILEVVDAVDIASEWFDNDDFCDRILSYFDFPSGIVGPYLQEVSGEGLLALVNRLDPRRGVEQDAHPSKAYPTPSLYARDKWIYENVHLHDCQTLSKMLEKECRRNHWKTLTSRNGLKIAADRYAGFSRLPPHRFPDDRVVS